MKIQEIPEHILQRKGAPNTAAVPAEVRALLDSGRIEAVNLSEWLIADQAAIAGCILPAIGLPQAVPHITNAIRVLPNPTAPRRLICVADHIAAACPTPADFDTIINALARQPSDIVRSWACHLVARRPGLNLRQRLDRMRPFAADRNMGVRECAWMAIREQIASQLEQALRCLLPFVHDPDPNIRRFATESTRPRGVWCSHIHALREQPELGLPLLEPLKADPARYVQNSVANWLNDASKSKPGWVRETCTRWSQASPARETAYICRRALRTLERPERLNARSDSRSPRRRPG